MKGFPEALEVESAITSIQDAFFLHFRMAFYLSLALVLPVLVTQIWGFVSPGLKPQERKPVKIVAPISVLLFFIGGFICWHILPITLSWFAGFADDLGVIVMQDPAKLVFLMVKMILAFGIGFQMPLIVFFLARFGIITPEGLLRYWRHSIFGVFVASALITPSGDPVGMLSMALPLTLLFFLSVYAAKWSMRGRDNSDDELNSLD
jgi:sec-independent protein translocase protein TatC